MDVTVTVTLTDATLTANDNTVLLELGKALNLEDPVNMDRGDFQAALAAWVERRIEAERNRGAELLLSEQLSANPLFPSDA